MGYFQYFKPLLLPKHLFYIWMEQAQTINVYYAVLVCFPSPNHSDHLELHWNTINVAIRLSTNIKVTINKTVCVCVELQKESWGNLVYPSRALCLPLPFGSRRCVCCRAELGHLFHISLHAQSRWVTAVIGIRGTDSLWRLSLSWDATPLPILSFRLSRAWRCQIHKRGLLHKHTQLRSVQASEM